MGRHTGQSFFRTDEVPQTSADSGSRLHLHKRGNVITVLAASAVIQGEMTLEAMLVVQYIIWQLHSSVEKLMSFIYSLQEVKITWLNPEPKHCRNGGDGNAYLWESEPQRRFAQRSTQEISNPEITDAVEKILTKIFAEKFGRVGENA